MTKHLHSGIRATEDAKGNFVVYLNKPLVTVSGKKYNTLEAYLKDVHDKVFENLVALMKEAYEKKDELNEKRISQKIQHHLSELTHTQTYKNGHESNATAGSQGYNPNVNYAKTQQQMQGSKPNYATAADSGNAKKVVWPGQKAGSAVSKNASAGTAASKAKNTPAVMQTAVSSDGGNVVNESMNLMSSNVASPNGYNTSTSSYDVLNIANPEGQVGTPEDNGGDVFPPINTYTVKVSDPYGFTPEGAYYAAPSPPDPPKVWPHSIVDENGKLTEPAITLLSLVGYTPAWRLRLTSVQESGPYNFDAPWYSRYPSPGLLGGGGITYENTIFLTENFYDNTGKYGTGSLGNNTYEWLRILSHEMGHLPQEDMFMLSGTGTAGYMINMGEQYLVTFGHKYAPFEMMADIGAKNFEAFMGDGYKEEVLAVLNDPELPDNDKSYKIISFYEEYIDKKIKELFVKYRALDPKNPNYKDSVEDLAVSAYYLTEFKKDLEERKKVLLATPVNNDPYAWSNGSAGDPINVNSLQTHTYTVTMPENNGENKTPVDVIPPSSMQGLKYSWSTDGAGKAIDLNTLQPKTIIIPDKDGGKKSPKDGSKLTTGNGQLDKRFKFSGETARPGVLSENSITVLNMVINHLNAKKMTITSTGRTPAEQARIMYDNMESGSSSTYGKGGRQVIAVYNEEKDKGSDEETIISKMTDKINEVGPENVSRHLMDPKVMNAIDFGINRLKSDIGQAGYKRMISYLEELKKSGKVFNYLYPANNKGEAAVHIEIKSGN